MGRSSLSSTGIQIGRVNASCQRNVVYKFGLCEDNQCVASPSPNKLAGWSKDCEAVKPSSCGSTNVYYYKLEGVDHTTSKHESGSGSMSEVECGEKCSSDCKCVGYFYNKQTSKCWIAYI
jgi:hypothetical protein